MVYVCMYVCHVTYTVHVVPSHSPVHTAQVSLCVTQQDRLPLANLPHFKLCTFYWEVKTNV